MKYVSLYWVFLFVIGPLHAATQSSALTRLSTTPKGETTKLNETPQSRTVNTSGNATCPDGTIMTGFSVDDSNSAYHNIISLYIEPTCYESITGWHLSWETDRVTNRLVDNATAFIYTLYCRPVSVDFY